MIMTFFRAIIVLAQIIFIGIGLFVVIVAIMALIDVILNIR